MDEPPWPEMVEEVFVSWEGEGHGTIKTTPAMAAGVTTRLWNLEELLT